MHNPDPRLLRMNPFPLSRLSLVLVGIAVTILFSLTARAVDPAAFSWDRMASIRQSIVVPTFPDRDFLVTDYGAVADGKTDCTQAFKLAIQACADAGGGRVVASGLGVYKTGPIHLKSNVNLHVATGSTLSFYTDPAKFLPAVLTRYEGVELMNYSPLIYAYREQNIAVTGGGVLDGGASEENWWAKTPPRTAQRTGADPHTIDLLFAMAEKGTPVAERVFGLSSDLRPTFIEPYECENVLIEGVTLINAPFWMIHPVLSKNITVRGVTCSSWGPNNDGCDPESSENVLIENCVFNTKDDGVAIKAGRNADGRRIDRPTRNVIVANCVMNTQHTAVAIGSEMTGGVEHIYIENLTCGKIQRVFRIKTNSMRGGFVRHIGMRNVTVEEATGTLIDFNTNYGRESGPFFPVVEDVTLSGIQCETAQQAISFEGTADMPIRQLRLSDITVGSSVKPSLFHHVQETTLSNLSLGFSPQSELIPAP
jgi:polygalacturonase